MKEEIKVYDYAQKTSEALSSGGILLNTDGEKFNSMVIGWGHLGRIWNLQTFTVHVREHKTQRSWLISAARRIAA